MPQGKYKDDMNTETNIKTMSLEENIKITFPKANIRIMS